jgi:hypothetical protein
MAMPTQSPHQLTLTLPLSLVSLFLYTLRHSSKGEGGKKKERRGGLELQQQEKAMEIT